MKRVLLRKMPDYSAPLVETIYIPSSLLCASEDGFSEDYQVDDTFEW